MRRSRVVLGTIKHVLQVPGKACVKRVHNNDAFVNAGNQHTRKMLNTAY